METKELKPWLVSEFSRAHFESMTKKKSMKDANIFVNNLPLHLHLHTHYPLKTYIIIIIIIDKLLNYKIDFY